MIQTDYDTLPFCCGVHDVGNFSNDEDWRPAYERRSGTGLFTATFIDNATNQEAYEQLKREHRLLYQSPVKVNNNSGNRLFLCVFEFRQPRQRRGERLPNL